MSLGLVENFELFEKHIPKDKLLDSHLHTLQHLYPSIETEVLLNNYDVQYRLVVKLLVVSSDCSSPVNCSCSQKLFPHSKIIFTKQDVKLPK